MNRLMTAFLSRTLIGLSLLVSTVFPCTTFAQIVDLNNPETNPFGITLDIHNNPYSNATLRQTGARWLRLPAPFVMGCSFPENELKKVPSGFRAYLMIDTGGRLPNNSSKYLSFLKCLVRTYGPQSKFKVTHFQILNEPNNPDFWRESARDYGDLLLQSVDAIKSVDPNAKIILGSVAFVSSQMASMGATNELDWWTVALGQARKRKADFGRRIDIVDLHSYDTLEITIGNSRKFLNLLNEFGFQRPEVWFTEYGANSLVQSPQGTVDLEIHQARYLVKMTVGAGFGQGFKKMFWFGMANRPSAWDAFFFGKMGLIKREGVTKPSFHTYKLMTQMFSGVDLDSVRILSERQGVYVYKFRRGSKDLYVAWSNKASQSFELKNLGIGDRIVITPSIPEIIRNKEGYIVRTQILGSRLQLRDERLRLRLDPTPIYVEVERDLPGAPVVHDGPISGRHHP